MEDIKKSLKIIATGEIIDFTTCEIEATLSFSGNIIPLAHLIRGIIDRICSSSNFPYDKFMEYVDNTLSIKEE